mmetsp:Transcript_11730/g.21373  ORF Transcript_11730/g.21373 Transcript_11730/m.21373 type:complete len:367 (+) Transcript_11730:123-1223(+)
MSSKSSNLEEIDATQAPTERPNKKARHLCSLGTGEVIHVLAYTARFDKINEFEFVVQGLARCLYTMESAVTDVRVCHPCCGEVVFIVTFVSKAALSRFCTGPQKTFEEQLEGLISTGDDGKKPSFQRSGTMMPAAHTLDSLLDFLKANVKGDDHTAHDVRTVSKEIERWFPRPSEYEQYISVDPSNPTKYTRNVVHTDENMDVILMCWPAGCKSSIHDHDASSCWVTVVEGEVHEVQYQLPRLDRKFLEAEQKDPANAIGTCGQLKIVNTACLDTGGVTGTYANNDIGIHRVENRSDKLSCSLHIYAPPLRKMKIFDEEGNVHVHLATKSNPVDLGDECGGNECDGVCVLRKGIFDVDAWNKNRVK